MVPVKSGQRQDAGLIKKRRGPFTRSGLALSIPPNLPPEIPMKKQLFATGLVFALLILAASRLEAQLPQPQLNSIYPPGGKAGDEVEVQITGKDLEEAQQLIFSHQGISATPKMTEPDDVLPEPRPVDNQFIVKIDSNVPAGIYEVSAVGRYGISNTRAFAVSKVDQLLATGDHGSREKAMEVPVGATVFATVNRDQINYYKIQAKKGQRVLVECCAERIDSQLDGSLRLYGPDGRELRTVHNTEHSDPVLDFEAEQDGQYTIGVHDFVYNGGSSHFYRLSVSSSPWIDFVFPPAGQPGSNEQYTIYGRNLPGGSPVEGLKVDGMPLQQMKVNIALPGDAGGQAGKSPLAPPYTAFVDTFSYQLDSPQGPSNPVAIGLAKAPVISEQESNDDGASANSVSVPCEYVGQLYPTGDADWISFEAKKGETYWLDLISHRLGAGTDPVLLIEQVKGEGDNVNVSRVAEVDDVAAPQVGNAFTPFDTGTRDAWYKLDVKEDATYRVMVRDLYGTGRGDPRFVYRLHISKAQPDFRLAAYPEPIKVGNGFRPAGVVLRRGGAAVVNLRLDRQHGFQGDVAISCEGLPAGVTCSETTVGGSINRAALVLTAEENAAAWAGSIRIVGKANVDGSQVTRTAVAGTIIWESQNAQQQPIGGRTSRTIPLAVVDKETSPAGISIGEGQLIETSLGGKVEWPIKLARRNDFKGDLKLSPVGLEKNFGAKDTTVKGDNGKFELALINNQIKAGTYTFYLRGQAKFKYARDPEAQKKAEEEQKRFAELVKQFEANNKEMVESLNKAKQAEQQAANELKQAEDQKKSAGDDAAKLSEAEQKFAEAEKKKSEAEAARVAAEEAAKKAESNLKRAQELKKQADTNVNSAKQQTQQKDVTTDVYSTAVRLRVVKSPVNVSMNPGEVAVKQGEKSQIKVAVERRFGFDDQVEVSIDPAGVNGVSGKKFNIAKGQNDGMLEISTGGGTPVGKHTCKLKIRVRFNNVTIDTEEPLVLNVTQAS